MSQYLTVAELAGQLRRSVSDIYRLTRERRIPSIRLRPRGRILYDPEQVRQALERAQVAELAGTQG